MDSPVTPANDGFWGAWMPFSGYFKRSFPYFRRSDIVRRA
jgi:hypothetical protein